MIRLQSDGENFNHEFHIRYAATLLLIAECRGGPACHRRLISFARYLTLLDGNVVHGLIIRNSRDSVLIQQETGELDIPKNKIVRIIDNADRDVLYTGMNRKGQLPSWRVIANDLRTHDAVKSLVESPRR